MYFPSTSENVFFSFPSPPQATCIQIPYKTPKKPSFCVFSIQIPFFAVIHRFCSWLSSVTQSHQASEHENTWISLTLLPRMSYRARRGTSPCLAAGLKNHRTEVGLHWHWGRQSRPGRAYVSDVTLWAVLRARRLSQLSSVWRLKYLSTSYKGSSNTFFVKKQCRTERWGGGWGFNSPPPEIPKAHQNRAKLNPIVRTVKNCWI